MCFAWETLTMPDKLPFPKFDSNKWWKNWKPQSMWRFDGTLSYSQVHEPHWWQSQLSQYRLLVEECWGLSALVDKEDNSAMKLAEKVLFIWWFVYSPSFILKYIFLFIFSTSLVLLITFHIKYYRQNLADDSKYTYRMSSRRWFSELKQFNWKSSTLTG